MTNEQARLQHQPRLTPQRTIKPVLLAVATLLALAWSSVWLLRLGEGGVMAASLATIVLGLLALGIRAGFGNRDHGATTPPQRSSPAVAGTRHAQSVQPPGNFITRERAAPLNDKRWSLDVFNTIDAERFAAVCETWFSWAGFDTRSETHRTDQGVDIWLHAAKVPGPVAIVRCKHWFNKPVGLQEMKEFLSVMAGFKSAHGTYTTTSTFTPEALQFAKEHGIDAVDGRGLLRKIQTRTPQRQQALLAVACNGQTE